MTVRREMAEWRATSVRSETRVTCEPRPCQSRFSRQSRVSGTATCWPFPLAKETRLSFGTNFHSFTITPHAMRDPPGASFVGGSGRYLSSNSWMMKALPSVSNKVLSPPTGSPDS